jgi:hypothetical protein
MIAVNLSGMLRGRSVRTARFALPGDFAPATSSGLDEMDVAPVCGTVADAEGTRLAFYGSPRPDCARLYRAVRSRNGRTMLYRYRLHREDGSDAGEAHLRRQHQAW